MTKTRMSQADKTVRAFGVYFDVLDAADYMRRWMRPPLEAFDLTVQSFRLLVYVYRDGPMAIATAAKKLHCARQNVNVIVDRLEERGLVRRGKRRRVTSGTKPGKAGDSEAEARKGHEFGIVRLTEKGESFLACVFPRHAKVVKALMRALDGRQQETLGELCRKLMAGDVMKFTSEITHAEEWEEIEEEEEEAKEAEEAKEVRRQDWRTQSTHPEAREAKEEKKPQEAEERRDELAEVWREGPPSQIEGGAPEQAKDVEERARAEAERGARDIEEERREAEARRHEQDEFVREWLAKDQRRSTPKPHRFARKRWPR